MAFITESFCRAQLLRIVVVKKIPTLKFLLRFRFDL